jgi:hypothetical protein
MLREGGRRYSCPTMKDALQRIEDRKLADVQIWEDREGRKVLRLQVGSSST